MKAKDAVKELFERINREHEGVIRAYLRGEAVGEHRLWLAVGYFEHGFGEPRLHKDKLFNKEEWRRLLQATRRSTDGSPYLATA